MTSFNTLNGVPATGNRFLLRQVLRDEWKYQGLVVSDYEAVTEMIRHGYARDARDAARKAANAGIEMEMVSTAYFDNLKPLVEAGDVPIAEIDDAVRNILRLKFRLGLFDQTIPAPAEYTPDAAALELAERTAIESAVLLKNQRGLLPLDASRTFAIVGPLADSPADQMGTWSMDGRPESMQTPLAAFRKLAGAGRVHYAPGLRNSRDLSRDGFPAAVAAARTADVVVLFLGEEAILSGEARSRAFLNLPGAQAELVDALSAVGKPLVVVIMAGRPLTFHEVAAKSGAVLYAWHPGSMGGPALAKLLLGRADPSAKLPITFPRTVGQIPIYYSHLNTGRPASEKELGVPMGNPADPAGYTSKYIDVDFTPEYPFGFGLSYTDLQYSDLRLSSPVISGRSIDHGLRRNRQPRRAYRHRNRPALYPGPGRECRPARPQTYRLPKSDPEAGRNQDRHLYALREGSGDLQRTHATRRRARTLPGLDRAGFRQRRERRIRIALIAPPSPCASTEDPVSSPVEVL